MKKGAAQKVSCALIHQSFSCIYQFVIFGIKTNSFIEFEEVILISFYKNLFISLSCHSRSRVIDSKSLELINPIVFTA